MKHTKSMPCPWYQLASEPWVNPQSEADDDRAPRKSLGRRLSQVVWDPWWINGEQHYSLHGSELRENTPSPRDGEMTGIITRQEKRPLDDNNLTSWGVFQTSKSWNYLTHSYQITIARAERNTFKQEMRTKYDQETIKAELNRMMDQSEMLDVKKLESQTKT